jgi:hypothetical protein
MGGIIMVIFARLLPRLVLTILKFLTIFLSYYLQLCEKLSILIYDHLIPNKVVDLVIFIENKLLNFFLWVRYKVRLIPLQY